MASRKKIDACAAKRMLFAEGIRFGGNVFTLSHGELSRVAEVAKAAGYRKSKSASGSTGRMYFEYLSRLKGCGADLGRAPKKRRK